MKKCKNVLDERQEQELLKVERLGFWTVFWGLLIVLFAQLLTTDASATPELLVRQVIGELAILVLAAIVIVIGCLRKGIWDRRLKPDAKTNFLGSLIGALLVSGFSAVRAKVVYGASVLESPFLIMSLVSFAAAFICCFVLLTICAAILKKRQTKLESTFDESDAD